MSEGREFQVVAAATEKACHARSIRVLGTVNSGASDDRRGRTHTDTHKHNGHLLGTHG